MKVCLVLGTARLCEQGTIHSDGLRGPRENRSIVCRNRPKLPETLQPPNYLDISQTPRAGNKGRGEGNGARTQATPETATPGISPISQDSPREGMQELRASGCVYFSHRRHSWVGMKGLTTFSHCGRLASAA